MARSILFVCLGNICRSPTAESVFRHKSDRQGLDMKLDSAGTSNWHQGEAAYGPMQIAAKKRGYDLSKSRARQITERDFSDFDLIIAMDKSNRKKLEKLRPVGVNTPIELMLDYLPDQPVRGVPDPYFTREFNRVIDLIELASDALLFSLLRNQNVSGQSL